MPQDFETLVNTQSPPFSIFSYEGAATFDIGPTYKPSQVLGTEYTEYYNP